MARRTRMRTRRPRTRRPRMRRPRTGKKSRGKMRRRRTRRPRMSKRFFMRGGNSSTNIKFLNITNNAVFLIGGLDRRGDDGQPIPGTKPIKKKTTVEPQKYLTVQNPEVNNPTEFTINDNGGNIISKFKLNTNENCLVIISDAPPASAGAQLSDDLSKLRSKIQGLVIESMSVESPFVDKYIIHKAPAGPENGATPSGKMDYTNMKSTTLNSAGFSSQI